MNKHSKRASPRVRGAARRRGASDELTPLQDSVQALLDFLDQRLEAGIGEVIVQWLPLESRQRRIVGKRISAPLRERTFPARLDGEMREGLDLFLSGYANVSSSDISAETRLGFAYAAVFVIWDYFVSNNPWAIGRTVGILADCTVRCDYEWRLRCLRFLLRIADVHPMQPADLVFHETAALLIGESIRTHCARRVQDRIAAESAGRLEPGQTWIYEVAGDESEARGIWDLAFDHVLAQAQRPPDTTSWVRRLIGSQSVE